MNSPRIGGIPTQNEWELFGAGVGEIWCPKCFGSGCDLCEGKGKLTCNWCEGSGVKDRVNTDSGYHEVKCHCVKYYKSDHGFFQL